MAVSVVASEDIIERADSGGSLREMWRSGGTMWRKDDLESLASLVGGLAV